MKISLAQIKVIPGQPSQNFEKIKSFVLEAKQKKVDLIIFPELCVGGSLVGDRYFDIDYINYLSSFNNKILELSKGIAIIWGNISIKQSGVTKRKSKKRPGILNTAFFAHDQTYVTRVDGLKPGLSFKKISANMTYYDEYRYFNNESITNNDFIFKKDGRDFIVRLNFVNGFYAAEKVYKSRKNNSHFTDLVINIASSPWVFTNHKLAKLPLLNNNCSTTIYVNGVGLQDSGKNIFVFDGGSFVLDKEGNLIANANDMFLEEHLIVDLNRPVLKIHKQEKAKLLTAVLYAIEQFDEVMFKKNVKWIIGLSGGLDSTLNAALLTMSLGKDRVLAYNLPSRFNAVTTKNNAKNTAEMLGISYKELAIENLINATKDLFTNPVSVAVEENIHARLRGHILSTFAQAEGGVICNNANKVEVALGYCTLYGDTIGALSPLGDLTKMEVNELALEVNRVFAKNVIPTNLIARFKGGIPHFEFPPSAELKDKQVDPMKWGYHDWLLNEIILSPTRNLNVFVEDYLNNKLKANIKKLLSYYGLDKKEAFFADLNWFVSTLHNSAFKRIQMPPIVTLSPKAFGSNFPESQTKVDNYIKALRD